MPVIDFPIDKIDIPNDFPDKSPLKREQVAQLAYSVDSDRLYQEIGLCNHPTDPERRWLVFGRVRLAAFKALKRKTIPAHDYGEMSDLERELATLTENTIRKHFSPAQRLDSMRRLYEDWELKNGKGSTDGRAITSGENKRRSIEKPIAQQATTPDSERAAVAAAAPDTPPLSPEGDCSPPPESVPSDAAATFAKVVANVTGKPLRTTQKDLQLLRAFTPDALDAMLKTSPPVSQTAMLLVASKVSDPTKRKQAVNLLIMGMDAEEVIKTVLAPDVTVAPDGTKEVNEGDLTDEQWLEHTCGAKRALIANTAIYDQEALLYRHDRDDRHQYMNKAKKRVRKIKGGAHGLGPFSSLIYRLLWVAHPKDWPFCAGCAGKGEVTPDGGEKQICTSCQGAGFHIKLEARS